MQREYFQIRINPDLHAKFKSKAALEKNPMSEVLDRILGEYIDREKMNYKTLANGHFTDMYFNRTRDILRADNTNPKILMQVFPRKDGILCGINEVTKILQDVKPHLEIRSLKEGDSIKENETVLTIEGNFWDFVQLETVYLGILARMSSIATNMKEIVDAAKGREVIMMSARFERPEMQIFDGYAAWIGGCTKFSTEMNCVDILGMEAVGTIPHALIAAYGGDTVKATLAFDKHIDKKVPRVALVDFENDCIKTSLEVARALGDRLYAVRLDTSKGMVDEGLKKFLSNTCFKDTMVSNKYFQEEFSGVCPELVRQVRENLDKEGFNHVKIVISGGFIAEKISKFVKEKVPFDIVGVGSAIYKKRFDFTADLVTVDGKPCAKKGRKYNPNNKLTQV